MKHDLDLLKLQHQLHPPRNPREEQQGFLFRALFAMFGKTGDRYESEKQRLLSEGRDLPSHQPGAWPL